MNQDKAELIFKNNVKIILHYLPIRRAIFQYLSQILGDFFTRNGVRLITEALGFKDIQLLNNFPSAHL